MFGAPIFRDRVQAGQLVAAHLREESGLAQPLVLALPRGGVPVAFEIARDLHGDLDIFLVRKIGVPGQEELALGAIASGGVRVINEAVAENLKISATAIDLLTAREQREIDHRERLYREGRAPLPIANRAVILVDDGLATGATMLAAVRAVKQQHPKRIVVAVPVASTAACKEFRRHVDEIVCLQTPEPFYAVGAWYQDFSQTTDEEVRELLDRAAHEKVGG
ncbi:MAG TPA: phosphoribosyltransferase [Bryobacteraceae bacterium]|nr:phosphoribosyltransferase [Bryobacteraceae bacterium]